ncbi:DMT family transporter [Paludibacterium yongneupense]|uniref:DMT family transporter n=1 Tax=Paludibacterium yongneupense TaxID=400061 RepID=UPI0004129A07|nr:DMT family transporter [Paludibacterium yongneupense]
MQATFITNNNTRGIVWVVCAMMAWSVQGACNRVFAMAGLSAAQIVFSRASLVVGALLLFAVVRRGRPIATRRPQLHLIRGVFTAISAWCAAYAISRLSLAVTNACLMSAALFMLPLGALFLRERAHWLRWLGVLLGFGGVLLIVRPSVGGPDPAVWVVLCAAVSEAMLGVVLKKASGKESTSAIIFWSYVANFLVFGAACGFRLPAAQWLAVLAQWPVLAVAAASSLGVYFCYIRAYAIGDASAVESGSFSLLLFSPLLGYLLFGESPPVYFWSGALALMLGILLVMFEPARLARPAS